MEKRYLTGHVEKSFLSDPEKRKKVEETRTIPFLISTDAKDRHRTVLNMKNWQLDNYNNNPIVGYQHNVYGDNMCTPPNPDDVIGSSRIYFTEENGRTMMWADATFEPKELNETADKIFRKVLAGTLGAASVGFLEVGQGRTVVEKDANGKIVDETYYFEGQELVEWSVVNIGSNPEATTKSLRNHTKAGLHFLKNVGVPLSQIRKMVNELLDSLEEPKVKSGSDPNLNKYKEQLRKFKQ